LPENFNDVPEEEEFNATDGRLDALQFSPVQRTQMMTVFVFCPLTGDDIPGLQKRV